MKITSSQLSFKFEKACCVHHKPITRQNLLLHQLVFSIASRSAFFCFCNDERPKVKQVHPGHTVGDIAKELGKRWEGCTNKPKYEAIAAKDKERYERVTNSIIFNSFIGGI